MRADDADVTDKELLSRHVAGDGEAFGEIVRRHRDRLWAVALRTLGDEEDAADALQDALVSAFRGAAGFRGDAAVTTWLHRIVVNACLDRARRRSAHPIVPLSETTDPAAVSVPDPTGAWSEARDVAAALAQLPAEQRSALVLVDMEGYSIEETARILEVPPGTIKSRCARGRARLVPILTAPPEHPSSGEPGNRTASGGVPSTRDREQAREGSTARTRRANEPRDEAHERGGYGT